MSTKTVLMIGNFLPQPKYNKNIWHALAERLAAAGWEVLTTSDKINRTHRLMDMVSTIIRERKRYSLGQIDVFSGKAFLFAEVCSWLLERLNKPIVLTLHGGGLPEFTRKKPQRMARVLRRGTGVITPSPYLQQELHSIHPTIEVIPNPIALSEAIFRQRQSIQPNLIWIRAFHTIYNPSMAVEVLHKLTPDFPNMHLTMVGPDKGDQSLQQVLSLVDRYKLHDQVEIIPGIPHTEIPARLETADIFINTSNFDTFPRSIIEAMANGLCIVSTNVGGIPYLVDHRQEALLVAPHQPEDMADAVRQILQNEALAERLSGNARKKAEEYDWSTILPQWQTLFMDVIEAHHGQA